MFVHYLKLIFFVIYALWFSSSLRNACAYEKRKIKAFISVMKHSKEYERNSLKDALKASSAEMSKKLNDRANLTQESYKEKSTLENQDFQNLFEENSFDVFIILSRCCWEIDITKITYSF